LTELNNYKLLPPDASFEKRNELLLNIKNSCQFENPPSSINLLKRFVSSELLNISAMLKDNKNIKSLLVQTRLK